MNDMTEEEYAEYRREFYDDYDSDYVIEQQYYSYEDFE